MDSGFLQDRMDALKALIIAYESALLAIGSAGGTESYTIDTGQTKQIVTRSNIPEMQRMLDRMYNQYSTLNARLNGGSVSIARPRW